MNYIDLGIILVLVLSLLFGLYRGFIRTIMGIASFILAWIIALSFYPVLAAKLSKNETIVNAISYYTTDNSRFGEQKDIEVSTLTDEQSINEAIGNVSLPTPLGKLLQTNILRQAFSRKNITTLGQYFNETVTSFTLNVLAFLILFFTVKVICIIVLHAVDYAMRLPILASFNTILGGVFGLLTGLILLFIIFSVLPVLLSAVPSSIIEEMLAESRFAQLFNKYNIISNLLRGSI
ncbi:MAG TPA: CvpA family protein [Clostridia bacterium]|nr:CvpA family protein [Clostridia bacterium]